MTTKTGLTLAAVLLAASVSLAKAQSPTAHDTHHPDNQPPGRAMPRGAGQPGGMGMDMGAPGAKGGQDMMMGGDLSRMMAMMRMMHGGMTPMGAGPGAMRPLEHIEGQLAFFKTELKITDAQTPLWNAFAETIRGNATRLRQAMMQGMEAKAVATAPEQMERRVTMLTAQLDAMRAVQVTAKPLYDALSDEQKKTADELMAQHFMAMRAGGM